VDWVDHLSPAEARAILNAPIKTRFMARDNAGVRTMRYTKLNSAETARLRSKAGE
jgi:hypothetical protein